MVLDFQVFLISTLAITLGELGDKTQLLALVFAMRYKKSLPIIMGILVATLCNHLLAGIVGSIFGAQIPQNILRWVMGVLFIGIALWTLKPDKLDEDEQPKSSQRSIFFTVFVAFFIAEMGDKTQIATIMLSAQYQSLVAVIAGTTLGMMIADVPTVLVGKIAAPKIPLRLIRLCAATIFAVIGVLALAGFTI